jgi:hypothetical protein
MSADFRNPRKRSRMIRAALKSKVVLVLLSRSAAQDPVEAAPLWQLVPYDNSLLGDHFAMSAETSTGYSIFFGRLDGRDILEIESPHILNWPFVASSSRLLFVEVAAIPEREFRLMDLTVSGDRISCQELTASSDFIGAPFIMQGKYETGVMFFSGRYNIKASVDPTMDRRLTMLRDERLKVLPDISFLTISDVAQIGSDQLIGTTFSYSYIDKNGNFVWPDVPLQDNSELVEITVFDDRIEAQPSRLGGKNLPAAYGVSFELDKGTTVIESRDFPKGGAQDMITIFTSADDQSPKSVRLPQNLDFYDTLPFRGDHGELIVTLLATERRGKGPKDQVILMDYAEGELGNARTLSMVPVRAFNTAECRKE